MRAPFDVVDGVFSEEIIVNHSPDQSMKLIISHCWNYKPGSNPGLFHLLDFSDNIIEHFTPHTTNGNVGWSKDSRFLALDIGENEKGILILDTMLMQVACIRTKCRDFKFHENEIVIFVSDKLMERLNSDKLIGGGITELPRIKYERPDEVRVQIDMLTFFPKNKAAEIYKLTETTKEIILDPIENGFWEFNGKLPQNTIDGYNNRDFEIYQLETFANFGDEQAIEWMNSIKAQNKPYKKFDKVSDYLGHQSRK